jgi:hypothetical protein
MSHQESAPDGYSFQREIDLINALIATMGDSGSLEATASGNAIAQREVTGWREGALDLVFYGDNRDESWRVPPTIIETSRGLTMATLRRFEFPVDNSVTSRSSTLYVVSLDADASLTFEVHTRQVNDYGNGQERNVEAHCSGSCTRVKLEGGRVSRYNDELTPWYEASPEEFARLLASGDTFIGEQLESFRGYMPNEDVFANGSRVDVMSDYVRGVLRGHTLMSPAARDAFGQSDPHL